MKKLLALAVLGLMSSTAVAADLGGSMKDTYESAVAPCGSKTWTGFTLSVGLGANIASAGLSGSDFSVSTHDFMLDAKLNADYQFQNSPIVVGAYGDLAYNIDTKNTREGAGVELGVAFGNSKPYILIGAEFLNSSMPNTGFAYGGGVDVRLTNHVVAGLEWKRVDWGTVYDVTEVKEDLITARIGYQF